MNRTRMLRLCAMHVATFHDAFATLCVPCRDFARLHFNYVATLCHPLCYFLRLMIRPWSTLSTLFDSCFDPDRLYRHCSSHDSNRIDPWFDPVRLMIRPCSTHNSTLFEPWFDPVRLMIGPCLTHNSTLFDSWFDPVWLMIRHYSTHGLTLFDSWFDLKRL